MKSFKFLRFPLIKNILFLLAGPRGEGFICGDPVQQVTSMLTPSRKTFTPQRQKHCRAAVKMTPHAVKGQGGHYLGITTSTLGNN